MNQERMMGVESAEKPAVNVFDVAKKNFDTALVKVGQNMTDTTSAKVICGPEMDLLGRIADKEVNTNMAEAIDDYKKQISGLRQSFNLQRTNAEKMIGIVSPYDMPNAVTMLAKVQAEMAKPEADRNPITIYHNNMLQLSSNAENPGFIKPENSGLLLGLVGAGEPEVQDEGIRKTETCQTVIPGVTFVREQQGIGQNNPQDFTQFRFTKQS